MKNISYENRVLESAIEREPNPHVPTIDIVRHGRTDYKELKDPNFEFDPTAEGFGLNPEHLDLNKDGIADAEGAARQLLTIIDKDNEVVILVTSPNFRAHSTALIIEEALLGNGVEVLNAGRIMQTLKLGQIKIRDKEDLPEWISADKAYRDEDPSRFRQPSDEAHPAIAARLGKELGEIFSEDYGGIDKRFEDYLRYMTNVYKNFTPETQVALRGKKLRIVTLTHEELPAKFMKRSLDTKENLKKGQILEIQPYDFIEEGQDNEIKVTLYAKPGEESESGETHISRRFNLE